MAIFDELEKASYKSMNGSLYIVLRTNKGDIDVAQLDWETIVDLNKAISLVSHVQTGTIKLKLPDIWWADNFKHFGECVPDTKKLMAFLEKWFVGSFAY